MVTKEESKYNKLIEVFKTIYYPSKSDVSKTELYDQLLALPEFSNDINQIKEYMKLALYKGDIYVRMTGYYSLASLDDDV